MSQEKTDLAEITQELTLIRVALSLLVINQVDAGDAAERRRHEAASVKALDMLLRRIEER